MIYYRAYFLHIICDKNALGPKVLDQVTLVLDLQKALP